MGITTSGEGNLTQTSLLRYRREDQPLILSNPLKGSKPEACVEGCKKPTRKVSGETHVSQGEDRQSEHSSTS